jgi:dTDP-4-amino-4,6-dideoxygalactose transaminase
MRVPLNDLKAQYRGIRSEIDAAIRGVLESSSFILGTEVSAFEQEFAAYCCAAHAVGVNSGTSALHLAFLTAGIGPGDEVITTPFTFVATVAAIYYVGATPVYADIEPASFNIDPGAIEAAITRRTKAIVPVHLYGQTADMDPILNIGRQHGIPVIEDAAQAHGSEYKGRRAGSMGAMACFSFYPGKNLGAYGEAGAVVTNDAKHAEKLRMLRDWGSDRKYFHKFRGYNYRMDGIQGAVLRVKLGHLERWTEARRAHAREYTRLLDPRSAPREMPYARHVYHVYVVRQDDRPALQQALEEAGVQYGIHYPVPVHLQEAYRDPRYGEGSFPNAEAAAREVLSLPVFPEMTPDQVEHVAETVSRHALRQVVEAR